MLFLQEANLPERTAVHIDGFNLYYGSLLGGPNCEAAAPVGNDAGLVEAIRLVQDNLNMENIQQTGPAAGASLWLRMEEEGADEALRRELDRLETDGEVEAMASLTAERWKERQRQKEAQVRAQAIEQGRAEGLESHRRLLASLAARRFGADTSERLSALLARVSEPERLVAVGNAIIDSGTGAELLAAARVIVGPAN